MNIELAIKIIEAVILVGMGVIIVVLVKIVNELTQAMSECESLSISMDNRLHDLVVAAERLDNINKRKSSSNAIEQVVAESLRERLNRRIEPLDGESPLDFPNGD